MTTYFEGSIIRSVRRLEELLNQLASAAKVRQHAFARWDTCSSAHFASGVKTFLLFVAHHWIWSIIVDPLPGKQWATKSARCAIMHQACALAVVHLLLHYPTQGCICVQDQAI